MQQTIFLKPPLNITQQVALYKNRGLAIPNEKIARHYLTYISYYRLSGYAKYFSDTKDNEHRFFAGTTFDKILNLYLFDRELRMIILEAVEILEVAVRSVINNKMCIKYADPHWYMRQEYFVDSHKFTHAIFLETIRKFAEKSLRNDKAELIYNAYYTKYTSPDLPPCWMIAETLSFGMWSTAYEHLRLKEDRKDISLMFNGLQPKVFQSWLHSLTYLRNLCAHHARVWNRKFSLMPKIIHDPKLQPHFNSNGLLYAHLAMINYLLGAVTINQHWKYKLYQLLQKYKQIDSAEMGFPIYWYKDKFWDLRLETKIVDLVH